MQAVSVQEPAVQLQAAAPAGTTAGGCQPEPQDSEEDDCTPPAKPANAADTDVKTALNDINAAITASTQPNGLTCALIGVKPQAPDLFGKNYWSPTGQSLDLTIGGKTWDAVQDAISKSVTTTSAPPSQLFIPDIALRANIPAGQPGAGKYVILMSFEYQTWEFYSSGNPPRTFVLKPDGNYKKLKHLLPPASSSSAG
jgi:hypothetical protein